MAHHDDGAAASFWSPFRITIFRAFWIANLVSSIGTWMHEIGAAWLMTSLTRSPVLIALVETAISLPIFLLALPAGALADILDRRRMLLFTMGWLFAVAATLGMLALMGLIAPWILIGLTFALGLGAALNAPVWHAVIPEMVPRADLHAAVTLNSAGFNFARTIGPALGGLVVASAGPWAAFLLNAVSYLVVIVVLYRWKRPPRENIMPAERITGAVRVGLRYVRHAPALHAVLIRVGAFMLFASAFWGLLPLFIRFELRSDPRGYGILVGLFGAGAVSGALFLARARRRVSSNMLVSAASLLFGGMLLILGITRNLVSAGAAMLIGGAAWLTLLSTLNASAQVVVPSWVRGRAIAFYLFAFFGSMAAGASLWGVVASRIGVSHSFLLAAAGLFLSAAATHRFRVVEGGEASLEPSLHWPAPRIVGPYDPDEEPVLVTVEYRIDPEQAQAFIAAMHELGRIRRRDGAVNWGIFRDTTEPGRYIEAFVAESWTEHLRHHERVTIADKAIEDRVESFHRGPTPPRVSHYIYASNVEGEDTVGRITEPPQGLR
ncbi:MAG: MFS transporter [Nitrospirota bacterium]